VESLSSGGFLVPLLVIPGGKPIFDILPMDYSSISWPFPAESLFLPWRASVGSPGMKNPPDGNNFRIPYSEGSLPHKDNFSKFKHENVIKMKNKPDPAILRPSNLSNEIKKGYRNEIS
jgi:hypothetical protein